MAQGRGDNVGALPWLVIGIAAIALAGGLWFVPGIFFSRPVLSVPTAHTICLMTGGGGCQTTFSVSWVCLPLSVFGLGFLVLAARRLLAGRHSQPTDASS